MASLMDIGQLGSEEAVFKRKFRWLFSLNDYEQREDQGDIVKYGDRDTNGHVAKISSRPSLSFNEQAVQHIIETIYLPAKASWDPIDIIVYDLKGEDYLYKWVKEFYNPELGTVNPVSELTTEFSLASIKYPKKKGTLRLLDGHGNTIEWWDLQGCWPLNIDWGELDYSSSDTLDVNFSLRYDRAVQHTIT